MGIVMRVVSEVVESSDVPPWALVIPMSYTENDLKDINELGKRTSQFKSLLRTTLRKYQQKFLKE
jgi:hypothetical protein